MFTFQHYIQKFRFVHLQGVKLVDLICTIYYNNVVKNKLGDIMEKEYYNKIINALDEKIKICKENFGLIKTKQDVENLSVVEARRLKDLAKTEVEDMTEIVMVELYHILGMGNLTVIQTTTFIRKMKEYLSYRPTMKNFSRAFNTLEDLPSIPPKTKYHLNHLGDFWLVVGGDASEAVEDICSVQDYKSSNNEQIKAMNIYFSIEGGKLRIHESYLKTLCDNCVLFGLGKNLNLETLNKKIENKGTYGGIQWLGKTDSGLVEGNFSSASILEKFKYVLALQTS